MKYLIGLCFFLLVTSTNAGGYIFAEIQQGMAFQSNWQGDYPTAVRLGIHQDISDRWYIRGGVEHISNVGRGCDFEVNSRCLIKADDRPETFLNQGYLSLGFRFYSW
jgi:hypothetical protein